MEHNQSECHPSVSRQPHSEVNTWSSRVQSQLWLHSRHQLGPPQRAAALARLSAIVARLNTEWLAEVSLNKVHPSPSPSHVIINTVAT